MSGFLRRGTGASRRRAAVAVCIAAVMAASMATAAEGSLDAAGSAPDAQAHAAKKKRCKKGYKRVTVKVKRKRHGKRVTVKVKKCRKAKHKSKPVGTPVPGSPTPAPAPGPGPAQATPKVDQVLGWSTLAQDPDTPPGDLVADGGTISTCANVNALYVYIRRSGITSIGQVSHVWKRDGATIASGSSTSVYNGAFRYGITFTPANGVYSIEWSAGGAPIGSASITRNC